MLLIITVSQAHSTDEGLSVEFQGVKEIAFSQLILLKLQVQLTSIAIPLLKSTVFIKTFVNHLKTFL